MLRAGQMLQLIVIALLGIAVIMVQSAGLDVGRADHSLASLLTSRHAMYAAAAIAAMLLASRINIRHIMQVRGPLNPAVWLLAGSLGLVGLAMVPGVGLEINGARRWLALGSITFQPSELVKLTLVIAVAWWCARRSGVMHRFLHGMLVPLVVVAATCGLIVLEDLGTAALLGTVCIAMLLAGGARLWQVALLVPPAVGFVVLAIVHAPYRVQRLMVYLDPWQDSQGGGYQVIQAMVAFAEGGLTGRGLGNGVQKFGYLPTDTSDMLFAVVAEELGFAGVLMVVGLYLGMLWVGLGVAKACRDTFGRLVAMGLLLVIGLQALINMAVVTALVPTKGIALPLLSAGGTGWVVNAFAIGLVVSLDRAAWLEEQAAAEGLSLSFVEAELDDEPACA